jgi:hypothetical protein
MFDSIIIPAASTPMPTWGQAAIPTQPDSVKKWCLKKPYGDIQGYRI